MFNLFDLANRSPEFIRNISKPESAAHFLREGVRFVKIQLPEEKQGWFELREKRKVLVLTNSGGGGHMAAANAVQRALGNNYTIRVEEPFKNLSGDHLFNKFQKEGNHKMLEMLTNMQYVAEVISCPLEVRPQLLSLVNEYKPDLIISVFPVANYLTLDIAQQINIPMLVLTTDLEARHFFHFIKNPGPSFKVGIAFDDRDLKQPLRESLEEDNFAITGYPIRPEFGSTPEQHQAQITQIRQELGIKEEDKVVLIMMGAQGVGDAVTRYSRMIANSEKEFPNHLHVVALCGSNEQLIEGTRAVQSSKTNARVTVHSLGRKDGAYVASLMRMSQVLISKPGGSSVNEAVAEELYTLFHSEGVKGVAWEAGNMEYCIRKGWGEEIDPENFQIQLVNNLTKPRLKIADCPGRRFDENIRRIVANIFRENVQYNSYSRNIKRFFDIQSRFIEGNETAFDKVIYCLTERETKEAIVNLLQNPQIDQALHQIIVEKKLNEETIGIFMSLVDMVNSPDKMAEMVFNNDGKNIFRAMENIIVRYVLKNHMANAFKASSPYILKALASPQVNMLIFNFCERHGIPFHQGREAMNRFMDHFSRNSG